MNKITSVLVLLAMLLLGWLSHASAQQNDSDWGVPSNISGSGAATSPSAIVDADSVMHVLWPEAALGTYRYAYGIRDDWSVPSSVELPFGTRQYSDDLGDEDATPLYVPTLITDANDRLHAFWRESDEALYYSQVFIDQLDDFEEWSTRQQLTSYSADMAAAIDGNGHIHLAYVQSRRDEGGPAGIYYRRLVDTEDDWSAPDLLYKSDYFQLLTPEDANIALAVSDTAQSQSVYVSWDDRSLERIYVARWLIGGQHWGIPVLVDQRYREDGPVSNGPSDVRIASDGNEVLLTWQAGHELNQCAQLYQWSTDKGTTWQGPLDMFGEDFGCPEKIEFVGAIGNFRLVYAVIQGQPFLMAWDGNRWSDPQSQPALASFTSPETFRQITLDCHRFNTVRPAQLVVIGCGTSSDERTMDIWQIARSLDSIEEWFPTQSSWTQPVPITIGEVKVAAPNLTTDRQRTLHAVWAQSSNIDSEYATIQYARLGADKWTSPVSVLSTPNEDATQPDMVIDDNDILHVVWIGGDGYLYYSKAFSERAIFSTDWTAPAVLASPLPLVHHADLVQSDDHGIFVAYTVPFNENRGVYLTKSNDDGRYWTEPTVALDGVAAGWDIVGSSNMVVGHNGDINILVSSGVLEPGTRDLTSQALYYVRSNNYDSTFTEPEFVTDAQLVTWSKMLISDEQIVHRFWQEQQENTARVNHEFSVDGGQTWSSPVRVSSDQGPLDVIVADDGKLVLSQISDDSLTVFSWDGTRWDQQEGLTFSPSDGVVTGEPQEMALTFIPTNTIGVVATSYIGEAATNFETYGLFAATGKIDLPTVAILDQPPIQTTIPVNPTPSPATTLTPAATETATPSADEDVSADGVSSIGSLLNNEIARVVLALLPVFGIILIILLYLRFRRMRD